MKKYELTNEKITIKKDEKEITLRQIKALKKFGKIQKGELGGFIESEKNLSQEGNCWIHKGTHHLKLGFGHDAYAPLYGKVYGNVEITGDSEIGDTCEIGTTYKSASIKIHNSKIESANLIFRYQIAEILNSRIKSTNFKDATALYINNAEINNCKFQNEICIESELNDPINIHNVNVSGNIKIKNVNISAYPSYMNIIGKTKIFTDEGLGHIYLETCPRKSSHYISEGDFLGKCDMRISENVICSYGGLQVSRG